MFTPEITSQLKYYVYRLIDPRNGETFYIGKGIGNRVFAHAAGELAEDGDEISEKMRRVREVQLAGFEVAHVIHRHGMDSKTALEVEAALLDAYPGTTNVAGGHHSGERGAMHAHEIIERFRAEPADFQHRLLAITINRTAAERSIYDAVRYAWKLDAKRARRAEYVLAVLNGLIVGAFEPREWLAATPENFPGTEAPREGRTGFVGVAAPESVQRLYVRKRLPDDLRKRGAANPVRYLGIS